MAKPLPISGIKDNYDRGIVADFLKFHIKDGSFLSVVSAFFTIYAYDTLKNYLDHIEDLDDTLSLTEFTLDDFRIELLKYLEANRSLLEGAPLGLYTCVPAHPEIKTIAPGVVFCLRQKTGGETKTASEGTDQINPLNPYFVVYVLADGNVCFGFTHPKQFLTMYRELCTGKGTPNEALCNLFDRQTQSGTDMSDYDALLKKAVESIAVTFRKRVASTLLTNRNAVIPDRPDQADESTDFELITWLVIEDDQCER